MNEKHSKPSDNGLTAAVLALTEWLKAARGCATLEDLQAAERRLTDLIKRSCGVGLTAKHRLVVFATGHDEPMKGSHNMVVTLKKPIKPGFRRAFTVGFDEDVDAQADGSFVKSEVVDGDSSAPTITESTKRTVAGFINGDGAIGNKLVRLTADGHVGEGDVAITLDVSYSVASPDATDFVGFTEGADEAIPV